MKYLYVLIWGALSGASASFAAMAPDATGPGPLQVGEAEYKFPAQVDPLVLPGRQTELWARMYYPARQSRKSPLLIFLHGNHGTCGTGKNPRRDNNCSYTHTGQCPENYVVVPNHLGYAYIARRLASWGYIVVSINANRGINCGGGVKGDLGLNLARGRLILRHMQLLSRWNTQGGSSSQLGMELRGRLDFSQLGIMGHSRGGEGARAAYQIYRNVEDWRRRIGPVKFRGIFEVAPVDGQTSKVLNPDGVPWTVLLPMCDGDVSNLEGVKPYDRMLKAYQEKAFQTKSTYVVWGANHNFYNTEWQVSDARGCRHHDPLWLKPKGKQRQMLTGLSSVMAFFRAHVGPQRRRAFVQNFDPLFELPENIQKTTNVERAFMSTPRRPQYLDFENFDQFTGTNTYGPRNVSQGIVIEHRQRVRSHERQRWVAHVAWKPSEEKAFFQGHWTFAGKGRSVRGYETFDFDISRLSWPNPHQPLSFAIQLVDVTGKTSTAVELSTYFHLVGPVGGPGGLHSLLQTVRIPLLDFKGVDFETIRGVRLSFHGRPAGRIALANLRFSQATAEELRRLAQSRFRASRRRHPINGRRLSRPRSHSCRLRLRSVRGQSALAEVVLRSPTAFQPRNELPRLRFAGRTFKVFRRPDNGRTDVLIYRVPKSRIQGLNTATVHYGRRGERIHCRR